MAAPYATIAEMISRYKETHLEMLLQEDITEGANAKLTEILSDASDIIESYCGAAGYEVPLSTTPGVIKTICRVLAYVMCWESQEGRTPPAWHQKRYDWAIEWLKALKDGDVRPDLAMAEDTSVVDKAQFVLKETDRDMHMGKGTGKSDYDTLGGFAIGKVKQTDNA